MSPIYREDKDHGVASGARRNKWPRAHHLTRNVNFPSRVDNAHR